MDRWAGRVALVTGAGSGIGASVAERLTRHGMIVVGCDRNIHNIQEMSASLQDTSGRLVAMAVDLRQEDQILAMFEEIQAMYGGVDVCVNSAGLGHVATLSGGETEKWREILEVNVLALSICTREAVRSMRARDVDDGHIVQMCSLSAYAIPPGYDSPMYCASKCAVRALAEAMRQELQQTDSGIRISCISPGTTRSGFAGHMRGREAGEAFYRQNQHLSVEDVADSVVYALSAPPHVQIHEMVIRPLKRPAGQADTGRDNKQSDVSQSSKSS